MEYTVVEICVAAMASGAAFVAGEPGTKTQWRPWVQQVLQESYSSAPLDRCAVVSCAIARALRSLVNEAVKVFTVVPESAVLNVEGAVVAATGEVCRLVGAWSGSSSSDTKHAHMLVYAVDLLMQVCPQ